MGQQSDEKSNLNYKNLHRMLVFVYDGDHETMSQNRNTGSGYDTQYYDYKRIIICAVSYSTTKKSGSWV